MDKMIKDTVGLVALIVIIVGLFWTAPLLGPESSFELLEEMK